MSRDILIVDDEKDIRLLVAGILEDEGYRPRVAADSDAALAMLEASPPPALVILDIWLQGSSLDGLELLKLLRRTHYHDQRTWQYRNCGVGDQIGRL